MKPLKVFLKKKPIHNRPNKAIITFSMRKPGRRLQEERYPAHFVSKISDSDTENSETNVWIDFSLSCKYIFEEKHKQMQLRNEGIGRLLNHMMNNPDKY